MQVRIVTKLKCVFQVHLRFSGYSITSPPNDIDYGIEPAGLTAGRFFPVYFHRVIFHSVTAA